MMTQSSDLSSPVRLAELFPREAIRVRVDQQSKSGVIVELVHVAASLGYLAGHDEGSIVSAVLRREGQASTALGYGIALPHCRWPSLERLVGVAGLLKRGIPFDAADGEPVDKVFLTLAPVGTPTQTSAVLGRLVALGRDKSLRLLLGACQTPEHVSTFLEELDQPVSGRLDELARMSLAGSVGEQRSPQRDLAVFSLTREAVEGRGSERDPASQRRWL